MNLRDYARDQPCQIRIPDVCNHNSATTVLCHLRMVEIAYQGSKPPDLIAAWGCSNCHDAVDRRRYMDLDFDFVRMCHLQGVIRTQAKLIKEGLVSW